MPSPFRIALISGAALATLAAVSPSYAAVAPSQVRVGISPGATDTVWKTTGVKFEKQVDCKVIKATSTTPAFPQAADVISAGTAKAPLFNPGLPNPDGTYNYSIKTPDNTIYVPLDLAVDPKSYVGCSGLILANGQNVTAGSRAGLAYATVNQIAGTGPIGVSPTLDMAKLSAIPQELYSSGIGHMELRYRPSKPETSDRRDFDTNSTATSILPGSDLQVSMATNYSDNRVPLKLLNNAQFSANHIAFVSGSPTPYSLAACKAQSYVPGGKEIVRANGYLCLKTSDGRYGAISLYDENISGTGGSSPDPYYIARFDFVVWK